MNIKDGKRYFISNLQRDFPGVSFPRDPSPEVLAAYGIYDVSRTPAPVFDAATERLSEGFTDANGAWEHVWAVVPLTQEELDVKAADAVTQDLARSLTPVQFEWLLAYTGLEDVWNGLLAATKGKDPLTYAMLKSQLRQRQFRLGVTLDRIAELQPFIAQVAPDADLSEPTIRAAWAQAEQATL